MRGDAGHRGPDPGGGPPSPPRLAHAWVLTCTLSCRRTLTRSRCPRCRPVWLSCLKIISGETFCQRRSLRSEDIRTQRPHTWTLDQGRSVPSSSVLSIIPLVNGVYRANALTLF